MSESAVICTTQPEIPDWVVERASALGITFLPIRPQCHPSRVSRANVSAESGLDIEETARRLAEIRPRGYMMNGPPDYGPYFDANLASNAPSLQLVTFFGDSLNPDHYAPFLDLHGLRDRGITVTSMPGASRSVAEATFGLILALNLELPAQVLAQTTGAVQSLGIRTGIDGRTLGVAGMGQTGQRVAELGAAFGMRIVYATQSSRPEIAERIGAKRLSLAELFERSDVVSIHLPGVTTQGLVDHAVLATANGITLVNTSSSPGIVDPVALIEALESGNVEKAAIEGSYPEPFDRQLRAFGPQRVIITPAYSSWNTRQTHRRSWEAYLQSLRAFVTGDPIPYQLHPRP